MIPFYKIVVNEGDDTGVNFSAFVGSPAHMKGFISFDKDAVRYTFNEEKRTVTGVMISVGTPIYRNNEQFGEHYVLFDAPTVERIRRKFFKNGFSQNVNLEHDEAKVTNGATLIDSYLISNSDTKLPTSPEAFSHMKLMDGSWIASYYITDDKMWEEAKSGKYTGFSVEGFFDVIQIKVKEKVKHKQMSNKNKTIWEAVKAAFSADGAEPQKFAEATTADGVVVMYDGELAEGSQLFVESEGEQLPAPEGEHELTLEDGSIKIVSLDGSGIVTAIADLEGGEPDEEAMKAEVMEAITKATKAMATATEARFKAIETELNLMKSGEKFKVTPKGGAAQTERTTMTVSEILKAKKK